jgi:hypothetical protein
VRELRFVLGLDLGQAADPSALCVLEVTERAGVGAEAHPSTERHFGGRLLRRWSLGTSYPAIVADVASLVDKPLLRGGALVVDATGVGRPCVDLFREAGLPVALVPVVITAGHREHFEHGFFYVAKVVLVSALQVALQQRRLKFAAGLPEVPALLKELQDYRVTITAAANETYNAREGAHDDLVLATALAVWWADVYVPPYDGPLCYNSWAPWLPADIDQGQGQAPARTPPVPTPGGLLGEVARELPGLRHWLAGDDE